MLMLTMCSEDKCEEDVGREPKGNITRLKKWQERLGGVWHLALALFGGA